MEIISHYDVTSSPWKEIHTMLTNLTAQGMSSDETDDDGVPEKRVRRVQLAFRNRELSTLLARLDRISRDGMTIKKDQRGNRVLPRIYKSFKVDVHRVVHGLPRNWYDPDWWRSNPTWEQSLLRAREPVPIPTLDL